LASGKDPDFHRRDLADAIEAGAFPQWDLALQVMPDTPDETFEGIDLLDPTKFVPEELAPLQVVGTMTLTANPTNYFAETEQVAFHPGHLVAGIDVTNDPLLQGRLFSYLDTQISRLDGPNFAQLPINRPDAPVNDMLRDGMHQSVVHGGVAPYLPNSLDGGCPFRAGADDGAFVDVPVTVTESVKERAQPRSFDDHFSQARLFYRSLTALEQEHVREAYAFELGKCYEQAIKERQLQALARIDDDLCAFVADQLGLPAPAPDAALEDVEPSPALRMVGDSWPIDGRVVAILADDGTASADLAAARTVVDAAGALPLVLAPHGGLLGDIPVQRTYATAASIEFDGFVALAATDDPRVALLVGELARHGKALGATPQGEAMLATAGVGADDPGVTVGTADAAVSGVLDALAAHRAWERITAG
ncbi:MAG TPA: catalase, partial [Microbacterium sp.]|nr:catalase [Microbacterium sp.]